MKEILRKKLDEKNLNLSISLPFSTDEQEHLNNLGILVLNDIPQSSLRNQVAKKEAQIKRIPKHGRFSIIEQVAPPCHVAIPIFQFDVPLDHSKGIQLVNHLKERMSKEFSNTHISVTYGEPSLLIEIYKRLSDKKNFPENQEIRRRILKKSFMDRMRGEGIITSTGHWPFSLHMMLRGHPRVGPIQVEVFRTLFTAPGGIVPLIFKA